MVEWILKGKLGRHKCGVRLKMVQGRKGGGEHGTSSGGVVTYLERNRCCVSHIHTVLREREREQEDELECKPPPPHHLLHLPLSLHILPSKQSRGSQMIGTWQCRPAVSPRGKPRCAHARGSGHLCTDSTTCSAGSDCQVCCGPSAHTFRYTPRSCPALVLSFFSSFIALQNMYWFVCLALGAWHRGKKKLAGVFKPPSSSLPGLHVTSVEEVWASWILLVGWVEGITRQGSAQGWNLWLLRAEMIQLQCFLRGSLLCCGIQRVEASPLGLPKGLYHFFVRLYFSFQAAAGGLAW